MARPINSKVLFLTTSPRTPEKMIPEIGLLVEHFTSNLWNNDTQRAFMDILREEQFFNGRGENDPALSARDRINRAPKSLGFVILSPCISLTPAGQALLTSKRKEEVFLRQMLKFQVPSPYHKPTKRAALFCVKPYLEMLRLVHTMGTLKFDELQIFGMQLTDWHNFESIVQKIEDFRVARMEHQGSYKTFKSEYLRNELTRIFEERISKGETRTRESNDTSLDKFLRTQSSNMRDYVDACFRYLRATGLVNVSHVGKSLSIVPERTEDVDYILHTIQYEMENEPVSRHLGKMKRVSGKPCYCLFVAPTINKACIAHFYALHNLNISYYGGKSVIIPLPLNIFQKMLEDSYKASYTPNSTQVRSFFEHSRELAKTCEDEITWYEQIKERALNWLS